MKNILFTVLALIVIGCKEEAKLKPKEYPTLITKEVVDIDNTGATFCAEILDYGTEEIIDCGFIWGETQFPIIDEASKKSVFQNIIPKNYTARINGGLVKDKQYFVRAYILTQNNIVYGKQVSFDCRGSLPPKIINFTPRFGPIGTKIFIECTNFSSSISKNIVKFGDIQAKIDSATEKGLWVELPYINKSKEVLIEITTAEMSTKSENTFNVWFPWVKKKDNPFIIKSHSTCFTVGNTAYVIPPDGATILTYNPNSDSWENDIVLPENSGIGPIAITLKDDVYLLLENSFWSFNSTTNTFEKKADFPGSLLRDRRWVFYMGMNNDLYIGNFYENYDFWQYKSDENKWYAKANSVNRETYWSVWGRYIFTTNNKGFIGIQHHLWEYDPMLDIWSSKTPSPQNAYGNFGCFKIGDDIFVGLGQNNVWGDGYVSNEIWRFNYEDDNWHKYRDCPEHLIINSSFSLNNKGYVLGRNAVYEFDPTKN